MLYLIADALHNIEDIIAIIITYIALQLGRKKATFKYTFGFLKAEMMAGFINSMFLFLTILYMIYEAINRFFNPETIEPTYMIIVGIVATIANGISAYILNSISINRCDGHNHSRHSHEKDINIKSAYLHMLNDALISVGVVIAGIFIYYFKIYYIDSIFTIIFSLYILKHSYPLLKKSFLSLMDINIIDISKEQLDKIINIDYHDLHIYKPSSNHKFISFHLVLEDLNLKEIEKITDKIKYRLKDFGFNHILIQTELKKAV